MCSWMSGQRHVTALDTLACLFLLYLCCVLICTNAAKITAYVCISDVYLDPNEEQVHLLTDWIFLLQKKYLTSKRWVTYRRQIDCFQLYSSLLNTFGSFYCSRKKMMKCTWSQLKVSCITSGEPPLTVDHKNPRSAPSQLLSVLWKTIPFVLLTISLQARSSWADDDASVFVDPVGGASCTHVSALVSQRHFDPDSSSMWQHRLTWSKPLKSTSHQTGMDCFWRQPPNCHF